jgi:hypothetical protein
MNPPNNKYQSLKNLIDEPVKHNENECREFISGALDLFVPYTGVTTVLGDVDEYPGHSGPNDLIVFCERSCGGVVEKHAYIWEIKSPQTSVFVKDTKNRVKPSPEFIKAENQMLHYWEDCKTEQFRAKFDISHLDYIHPGGILIGKTDTLVSSGYVEDKKKQLYKTAINLRKKLFYTPAGIQVLIWDDVLDFIKPPTNISHEKSGDIGAVAISGREQLGTIIGGQGS